MYAIKTASIKAASRLSATATSAAVDVSEFQGICKVLLNSSATEAADNTADVKLNHSDTEAGTYTDVPGGAFARVTNAVASHQEIMLNADVFKKYVKVVSTLGGTTPAVTNAVTLVGKKQSV